MWLYSGGHPNVPALLLALQAFAWAASTLDDARTWGASFVLLSTHVLAGPGSYLCPPAPRPCRCYPNSPREFHGKSFLEWRFNLTRPPMPPPTVKPSPEQPVEGQPQEQQPQEQQPQLGGTAQPGQAAAAAAGGQGDSAAQPDTGGAGADAAAQQQQQQAEAARQQEEAGKQKAAAEAREKEAAARQQAAMAARLQEEAAAQQKAAEATKQAQQQKAAKPTQTAMESAGQQAQREARTSGQRAGEETLHQDSAAARGAQPLSSSGHVPGGQLQQAQEGSEGQQQQPGGGGGRGERLARERGRARRKRGGESGGEPGGDAQAPGWQANPRETVVSMSQAFAVVGAVVVIGLWSVSRSRRRTLMGIVLASPQRRRWWRPFNRHSRGASGEWQRGGQGDQRVTTPRAGSRS
jgi:hypothetical protein